MKLLAPQVIRRSVARRLAFATGAACGYVPIFFLLLTVAFGNEIIPFRDPNEAPPLPMALPRSLFGTAFLSGFPAALIGAYAMHRAVMQRSENVLIGGALLAFASAAFSYAVLQSSSIVDGVLTGLCAGSCFGPVGLVASLLLSVPLTRLLPTLAAPSCEAASIALFESALPLGIMTVIAALAMLSASPSCEALFAGLDVTGLGATCLAWLVFVGPPACATLLGLVIGRREKRSRHLMRHAILSGTHPEYYPGDIAPGEDAIPLTETDRRSAKKRALMRRESSAYRGGEGNAVRVYVGVL
jgi:hypothetical protein